MIKLKNFFYILHCVDCKACPFISDPVPSILILCVSSQGCEMPKCGV